MNQTDPKLVRCNGAENNLCGIANICVHGVGHLSDLICITSSECATLGEDVKCIEIERLNS